MREDFRRLAHGGLTFNAPLSEGRASALVAALPISPGHHVLDLGCGWGELLLRILAAHTATTGTGVDGLRAYIRQKRQDDFVANLSRKLLAYALGRSLLLSDELTIDTMRTTLAKDGYRFGSLVEGIVTSEQFRYKRSGEER